MKNSETPQNDTRKVFWEKGSCSHTFFYLLNREFGHNIAHNKKAMLSNPAAKAALERFKQVTGGEMRCHKICGKHFDSIEDHTNYLSKGGCKELIEALSEH